MGRICKRCQERVTDDWYCEICEDQMIRESDHAKRIADLEAELAECRPKAAALDWVEKSEIALLVGVEDDGLWHAKIATVDYVVHDYKAPKLLEAIESLKQQLEGE